ncbi:MAG: hypothetical protein ACLFPF_10395 [Halanaerobiales bacterium]
MPKQQQQPNYIDYNFTGGLNVDSPAELLSDNELTIAKNAKIIQRGGIRKRSGVEAFNPISYDGIVTQVIEWPRKDGSINKLAVIDESGTYNLYDITSGIRVFIEEVQREYLTHFNLKDKLYFIDGDELYIYNGSSVTTAQNARKYLYCNYTKDDFIIGETLKKNRLLAASDGGDSFDISGTFNRGEKLIGETSGATARVIQNRDYVVYVYDVNGTFQEGEEVESEYGDARLQLDTLISDTFTLKNILYDNENTILGIDWYDFFSYSLNNDNWVEGLESGSIASFQTVEDELSNKIETIKKCKYAIKHTNSFRFFYAGNPEDELALYYSEFNQPDFVKGSSVIYPTEAEGPIVAIDEMMGQLVVSYKNGDWVYQGIDPAKDASWKKIPTVHGANTGRAITLTTNSLTSYADTGLYAKQPSLLGMDDNMMPGKDFIMNLAKDKVESILTNVTHPEKAISVYDPDEDFLYLAFCDDNTGINNKILVYNWYIQAFTLYEGFPVYDMIRTLSGDILVGSENYIFKLNKTTNDIAPDGTEKIIDFNIKTGKYKFGQPMTEKKISRLYIKFKNYGATHELNITVYADGEAVKQFPINGDDTSREVLTHREKLTATGTEFEVEVSNSQYSDVEIYGIGFDVTIIGSDGKTI